LAARYRLSASIASGGRFVGMAIQSLALSAEHSIADFDSFGNSKRPPVRLTQTAF
jgi:hypothetical protein